MKKFLLESAVFLTIIFVSFYLVALRADGYTDPFYLRYTTKKQSALIIGTSRAAQGIHPDVLNEKLGRDDFFNYSFTITASPYGPAYLESIKRKLDPDTKDGIFIMAVDPWSISSNSEDPEKANQFKETSRFMGKTKWVNLYPNLPYLLESYEEPLYKLFKKPKTSMFLHDDGWLEVTIWMDSNSVKRNIEKKVADYRNKNLIDFKYSKLRVKFLEKTIEFLKTYGKVYLVRMPVHPLMMEIDSLHMPDFEEIIKPVYEKTNTPYLNLTYLNSKYIYTDGNHLYKGSGAEVTGIIADWILKLQ